MPDKSSDPRLAPVTEAIVAQHDEEMCAFLRGEVPANQWRPEEYAKAVLRVVDELSEQRGPDA